MGNGVAAEGNGPLPGPEGSAAAARLRGLRARLGLSQEQLARELGVSFATVNRWESGRTRMSARAGRAIAAFEARAAAAPTSPLPVAASSFIGRERELAELAGLLGRARLLSLTGPGGAGKTRLAVQAVSRHAAAADIVFIPLDAVHQPGSLLPAVASRLHVADQPGVPLAESVAAALREAPRLLLLDGAEHLRDAVATLAAQLASADPGVRIVVTSRVVLGAPGEVCWTVPPLDCPSAAAGAADVAASDAVQLFLARARDRLPGLSTADVPPHAIGELCRRLDGLPLAIELIASWVSTLSIQEILQQRAVLLDQELPRDGQARGRRLVDVVRASHDLLQPAEQRLPPS